MYCPRCDKEHNLPRPGGVFMCDRIQGQSPTACYIIEHLYKLQMENPSMAQVPGTEQDPLLQEREKTHGRFEDNAKIFNDLTTALPDTLEGRQRAAMVMICMKIARVHSQPKNNKDSWLDIAGYAKLGAEACDA